MKKYPKGLFHDQAKKRWRTRYIVDGHIIHSSYHKSKYAAGEAYAIAVETYAAEPIKNPVTCTELLTALHQNYG